MWDEPLDYASLSRRDRIEAFKNMLVASATGGSGDDTFYRDARSELMNDTVLSERMPRFVRTCRNTGEFWEYIKQKLSTYAERREYLRDAFDPLLTYLEEGERSPMAQAADLALQVMTDEAVHDVWRRMLKRRESDPEGAITAARTLVETVCKHILDDLGAPYDQSVELPGLYKAVTSKLNLAPDQHTEEVFKQILGGCVTVVHGLAGVRNRLGDAHGKGRRQARPSARHAALAVNVAGSLAAFLVATWAERKAAP